MTGREQMLVKAILQAAHDADGHQLDEIALHAAANQIARMSGTEFNAGLAICSSRQWLTGVASRHNARRLLWNINDAGEAALLQL
jgi:hypothetical protein